MPSCQSVYVRRLLQHACSRVRWPFFNITVELAWFRVFLSSGKDIRVLFSVSPYVQLPSRVSVMKAYLLLKMENEIRDSDVDFSVYFLFLTTVVTGSIVSTALRLLKSIVGTCQLLSDFCCLLGPRVRYCTSNRSLFFFDSFNGPGT